MSQSTTSGRVRRSRRSPSRPSAASPTSSSPGSDPTRVRSPIRTSSWSSTTATVIGASVTAAAPPAPRTHRRRAARPRRRRPAPGPARACRAGPCLRRGHRSTGAPAVVLDRDRHLLGGRGPAGPRPTWPRRAGARWSALPARRRRRPRRPARRARPAPGHLDREAGGAHPRPPGLEVGQRRAAAGGAPGSPEIVGQLGPQGVQRLPGAVPDRLERAARGRRDRGPGRAARPRPASRSRRARGRRRRAGPGPSAAAPGWPPPGPARARAMRRARASVPIAAPAAVTASTASQLPQRPLVVVVGDGPQHERGTHRHVPATTTLSQSHRDAGATRKAAAARLR